MSTPARNSRRKTVIGFVSSKMGDKSVKVTVPYKTPHPLYHKVINRKTVLHVHDEKNETKVGDKIEVMETRPISRLKRWRITRILERGPEPAAAASLEVELAAANPPADASGAAPAVQPEQPAKE
jgi:small subunit ribosomal protein S17